MPARYSGRVAQFQTLPRRWLLSDARNDAGLEDALARLPRPSGFVFRHYHLEPGARQARFAALAEVARAGGHCVVLSGTAEQAYAWGAEGIYGALPAADEGSGLLRLATAHDEGEIARANEAGVDGVFLSPVFATRSHPDAPVLGPERFRALERLAAMPVIALGGMDEERAARLGCEHWGAIDGLS